MRLSVLVSELTPATFTIVATILFVAVFVGVAIRALRPGARAEHERNAQLPLGGDP